MSDYNFDAKGATSGCIKWISDWFEKNGSGCKAVIGISGGKDSTVTAKLCVEALGKDRVVGILMPNISYDLKSDFDEAATSFLSNKPNPGKKTKYFSSISKYLNAISALNDGLAVCNLLDIQHYVSNIYETAGNIWRNVDIFMQVSEQAKINMLPRIRMTMLYAFSQSLNGRVACTSNLSERLLGYGTRWGDTVGDFSPLGELTCTEVKKIGYQLDLPKRFIERTPDDGLCGKSDEENFGFTYAELDEFIRTGKNIPSSTAEISMMERMNKNEFKLKPIATFDPSNVITG